MAGFKTFFIFLWVLTCTFRVINSFFFSFHHRQLKQPPKDSLMRIHLCWPRVTAKNVKLNSTRSNGLWIGLEWYMETNRNVTSGKDSTREMNGVLIRKQYNTIVDNSKNFYDWRLTFFSGINLTHENQPFLVSMEGFPHVRFIYINPAQMQLLENSTPEDELFVDGTFDICPPGYDQTVTLLFKKHKGLTSRPPTFALLQGKKQGTYISMWKKITELVPSLLVL